MQAALKDVPEQLLEQPQDMVTVKIDPETGLLAGNGTDGVYETFRSDYLPLEYSKTFSTTNQEGSTTVEPIIDLF